jgi:3-oxoacyl-[acyl-carrier-protein] synthase-3
MQSRNVRILGTGKYLPKRKITASDMDKLLGMPSGWVLKKTDVALRHFVQDETASYMGAQAAQTALADAGLSFADIDCLVCASGSMEQPIPCTAVLIQKAMGEQASGVPAFDINSTCLSFLTALDVMSCLVDIERYRRILIVSTEVASNALNWQDKESAALFGDGAAAVVIGKSEAGESSQVICASMKTYSQGAHLSEVRGGGTRYHPREYTPLTENEFLFNMDGSAIFKMASKLLPDFVADLLKMASSSIADISLVIPHQGSAMAMRLLQRKLGISDEQLIYITPDHGNTIAAAIPMGLHEAIRQQRMKRGDRILLLGTSAGLSLGGLVLDY